MASHMDDHFLFSPVCEVVWAGFRSTTVEMQRAGWEFAVERAYDVRMLDDDYRVVLRHRDAGWTGLGELSGRGACNEFGRYSMHRMLMLDGKNYPYPPPPRPTIVVHRMAMDDRCVMLHSDARFDRVDMMPDMTVMPTSKAFKTLQEFGVFRPWKPKAEDIIVEPATVASLLEQIHKLQDPELAAIRRRNYVREQQQPREEVVCQIIQLAA